MADRMRSAARSWGAFIWNLITDEPPQPSPADLIQRAWCNGVGVPESLIIPDVNAYGQTIYRWPVMQGHWPYSRCSEVFRFKVWPGEQTTQQFKEEIPEIQSAMQAPIWYVADVPEDVNCVDLYVGIPPSFDQVQVSPQMLGLYTAGSDWSVYLGWNVFGKDVWLKPSNKAGMLISGLPGSGKTVTMLRILEEWRAAGAVIRIADYKDGGDYQSFAAPEHPVIGGDMERTIAMLEDALREMDRRSDDMKRYGVMNYWDAQRRPPLYVVVIDECQELFETSGVDRRTKALAEKARTLVRSLVKRGRSRGMFVCLLTQKPDSTAIPTNIRDVCELKISGRQSTRQSSEAALGNLPVEGMRPNEDQVIPPNAAGRMIFVGQESNPVLFQTAPLPELMNR